jgi:hypothetical protein
MAIQKRFIHFKKFSDFNSKKLSANEANTQYTVGVSGAIQDGEPDILYQSYVWIKDTQQQWTHGQLYDGSSDTYTTEFTVSDLFSISEDSPLTINKEALVNAVLSDKLIIIPYQDNKGCYVVSIDAFDEEIYFNIHFFASVVSFVIYPNELTNEITVEDIFMTDFQEALISGENIRTINGEDIIGDGSDLELATKDELNAKADDASVVHTEGDETIRGTKTFYTGPKFLSSGDTNAIKFGTDTRINVDNLDGTTNTILGFIRQQFIVNSQRYPLYLNGQQERPKYNNFEDLALLSDVNNAVNDLNTRLNELGDQSIIPITWAELKDIRDNSLLKPGQQYRITDYVTTTTQEDTRSAGHQFDVIVTADDEKTLNEVARACLHEGDTYFSEAGAKLEAWQIWYSLDNDTERFAWADGRLYISKYGGYIIKRVREEDFVEEGQQYYAYLSEEDIIVCTKDEKISIGSIFYSAGDISYEFGVVDDISGKGVIYRMIDEWGNDCPYDFKNIMYVLDEPIVECEIQKYGSWFKGSFTRDSTNDKVINNEQYYAWFYSVTAGPSGSGICYTKEELISVDSILYNDSGSEFSDVKLLSVISEVYTFGTGKSADLSGNCYNNSIGVYITLGKQELNRIIFGVGCYDNTFGDYCQGNTFGVGCYGNTFGDYNYDNSFGYSCNINTFGNHCQGNTFGNFCQGNTFGIYCCGNTFGNHCNSNTFGDYCDNNSFGYNCYNNTFGIYGHDNTFGDNCYGNTFGNSCNNNSFRSGASENAPTIGSYQYNHFDDGCSYNVIWCAINPSSDNPLRNININRGVCGEGNAYNYINIETLNSEHEINVNQIDGIVSVGEILSIRHATLKSLRDNGQLIAGQQYRIIDYITTTSQADTQSAFHQFDLIVTADDEKTLNEKARAIQHEGDTYFANNDLNAWEIWYCLDNDTERFAWGGESETRTAKISAPTGTEATFNYANVVSHIVFNSTVTELKKGERVQVLAGPPVYVTLSENGKSIFLEDMSRFTATYPITVHFKSAGVIYRMIDEHDNEAPYDFKNIQFKRCKVTSDLEGADLTPLAQAYVGYSLSGYGASMPLHTLPADTSDYKYVYTFSCVNNGSIVDASLGTSGIACYDNSMKLYIASNVQYLNDIVMYAHPESGNHCITKNTFASDCFSMTLGCEQVGEVWDNHFGQYCKNNIILGPYVYQNDFGANLTACYFSQQISQNQIGSYMQRNFVNNAFIQNVLGPSCKDNIFMKKCSLNTIGEQFMNNTCNDEFYQNNLGAGFLENTFNAKFYSNVSYNQFIRNTINGQCSCCDFGTQCTGNTLGIFRNSKVGSLFMSNVMCDTMACVFGIGFNCNNVTATKMQCSTFGTYVMYNNWTASGSVKNIKVSDNLQGTTSNYNNIELPVDSLCEIKVSRNSSGDIKIYCEADLIS